MPLRQYGRRRGQYGNQSEDPLARDPASDPTDELVEQPTAQPNFDRLVRHLQGITDGMGLIPNLLAINDRLAQTRHEELVGLIRGLDGRLDRLETKLTANEHNSVARNRNTLVFQANGRLSPLKNSKNEDVPNFPETLSELLDLDAPQINRLLLAFNLSNDGDLPDRRRRFQTFIGVGINC